MITFTPEEIQIMVENPASLRALARYYTYQMADAKGFSVKRYLDEQRRQALINEFERIENGY